MRNAEGSTIILRLPHTMFGSNTLSFHDSSNVLVQSTVMRAIQGIPIYIESNLMDKQLEILHYSDAVAAILKAAHLLSSEGPVFEGSKTIDIAGAHSSFVTLMEVVSNMTSSVSRIIVLPANTEPVVSFYGYPSSTAAQELLTYTPKVLFAPAAYPNSVLTIAVNYPKGGTSGWASRVRRRNSGEDPLLSAGKHQDLLRRERQGCPSNISPSGQILQASTQQDRVAARCAVRPESQMGLHCGRYTYLRIGSTHLPKRDRGQNELANDILPGFAEGLYLCDLEMGNCCV